MIEYIKKEVDVPECFIYQGRLLYEVVEDIRNITVVIHKKRVN